jgi:hypothetical protein
MVILEQFNAEPDTVFLMAKNSFPPVVMNDRDSNLYGYASFSLGSHQN